MIIKILYQLDILLRELLLRELCYFVFLSPIKIEETEQRLKINPSFLLVCYLIIHMKDCLILLVLM